MSYKRAIRWIGLPQKGQFASDLKIREGKQWFPFRQWKPACLRTSSATGCSVTILRSGHTMVAGSLCFGLPTMPSLECFNCWHWLPFCFYVFPLSVCLPLWAVGSSEILLIPTVIAFIRVMRECTFNIICTVGRKQ